MYKDRDLVEILGFRPGITVKKERVYLELNLLPGRDLGDLLDWLDRCGGKTRPVYGNERAIIVLGSDGVGHVFRLRRNDTCLYVTYRCSQTVSLARYGFTELPRCLLALWSTPPACHYPVIKVTVGDEVLGAISLHNLREQANIDRIGQSVRVMMQRAIADQRLVYDTPEMRGSWWRPWDAFQECLRQLRSGRLLTDDETGRHQD